MILDAPFVLDQGPGLGKWKPSNYSKEFYGPTPMRVGIEKSRNLMTVRLAQTIGMQKVVDYARRFGIVSNMDPVLSMSLGAGDSVNAMFHLTTHAMFKALLFLSSGVFIHALHSNDMVEIGRAGGRRLKAPMICMTLAAASLVGLPPLAGMT